MATLIKKTKTAKFDVGDRVLFSRPFILEHIGTSYETTPATVVKVNSKTYHVKDDNGFTWKVYHEEVSNSQ